MNSTAKPLSLPAVALRWRLHFEFVTAREPMEPPTVLQNQSEVTVWAGAEHVDVDTFSWDLPIKVLPTNPALASYVSQFTGTNSINIWLWDCGHGTIRCEYGGLRASTDVCVCVSVYHRLYVCVLGWERGSVFLFSFQMRNVCTDISRAKNQFFCFHCICRASDGFHVLSMQVCVLPLSYAFFDAS